MKQFTIKAETGIIRYNSLVKKYESDIAEAQANLAVYFQNSVGIGEHSDLQAEFDLWLDKLASATDKLDALNKNFTPLLG